MKLVNDIVYREDSKNKQFPKIINKIIDNNDIDDNDKKHPLKTILLFGSWGSGKTYVLEALQEEMENTGEFVELDAWRASDDLVKREFFITSYNKLFSGDSKEQNSDESEEQNSDESEEQNNDESEKQNIAKNKKRLEEHKKKLSEIEIETKHDIHFLSVLLYLFVFICIPILGFMEYGITDPISQYWKPILFTSFIFFLLTMAFSTNDKFKNIVFPFLGGNSSKYSTLKEGEDFTQQLCNDYFKTLHKDFESVYNKDNKKDNNKDNKKDKKLIFLVENIDRLPTLEDKLRYIENLYMFIKSSKQYKNVWFIITTPNSINHEYAYLSALDKLSLYPIYIAPLSQIKYQQFIFDLLKDSEYKVDVYIIEKICEIYEYFKEMNSKRAKTEEQEDNPNEMNSKRVKDEKQKDNPYEKIDEVSTTYRFIKKFVNALILLHETHKKEKQPKYTDLWEICSYVACSLVFYLEQELKELCSIEFPNNSAFSTLNSPSKEPTEDHKEWFDILIKNRDKMYKENNKHFDSTIYNELVAHIQSISTQEVYPSPENINTIFSHDDNEYIIEKRLEELVEIYSDSVMEKAFLDTYKEFIYKNDLNKKIQYSMIIYKLNPNFLAPEISRHILQNLLDSIAENDTTLSDLYKKENIGTIIGILYKTSPKKSKYIKQNIWKVLNGQ